MIIFAGSEIEEEIYSEKYAWVVTVVINRTRSSP
jgi:hypothetical protein